MPYVNLALASTIRTNLKKNPQAAKECQSHYQGMTPPPLILGGWSILKSHIFQRPSFFEILEGSIP